MCFHRAGCKCGNIERESKTGDKKVRNYNNSTFFIEQMLSPHVKKCKYLMFETR